MTSEFTSFPTPDYREHFFKVEENILASKAHKAIHSVVNFCNAGVVTHDRWIGYWCRAQILPSFQRENEVLL
jgi:hypothetical protein